MKRPSLRRVIHVVGLLILIASVIPFVLYAVPEAAGADQSYVVMSESMTPAIPMGSIVLVEEKANPAAYEKGDVITFQRGGESVSTTHRIVSVEGSAQERAYVTKGDASEEQDAEPVPHDRVIGEVTLTIPYAGHVVLAVNSRYGFYALVAIPLILLIADTAWQFATKGADQADSSGTAADTSRSASSGSAAEPVSTADTSAAEPLESADEDSNTITITPTDLRVTAVVLVGFAAYSGWTLSRDLSPVTAAVTVATVAAALSVLSILALTARRGTSHDSTGASGAAAPGSTESERRLPSVPPSEPDGGSTDAESTPVDLFGTEADESGTLEEPDGAVTVTGVDPDDD